MEQGDCAEDDNKTGSQKDRQGGKEQDGVNCIRKDHCAANGHGSPSG